MKLKCKCGYEWKSKKPEVKPKQCPWCKQYKHIEIVKEKEREQ